VVSQQLKNGRLILVVEADDVIATMPQELFNVARAGIAEADPTNFGGAPRRTASR
jgi:hypothetical protein